MSAQSETVRFLRRDGNVVEVNGALTLQTVTTVLRESREMFSETDGALSFDLASVGESDSAALALLLEWLRQGRREDREVRYRNIPQRLLQLARISELDGFLGSEAV